MGGVSGLMGQGGACLLKEDRLGVVGSTRLMSDSVISTKKGERRKGPQVPQTKFSQRYQK